MTWVHWVMYDIPSTVSKIPAQISPTEKLPFGGTHGITDFKRLGYGGPCPPIGRHRYFFKLFALDTILNLPAGKTKTDIQKAMKDHILAETVLMGTYQKI